MKNQNYNLEPVVKTGEVIGYKRVFDARKRYSQHKFTKENPNPNWSNSGMTYSEWLDNKTRLEMGDLLDRSNS